MLPRLGQTEPEPDCCTRTIEKREGRIYNESDLTIKRHRDR